MVQASDWSRTTIDSDTLVARLQRPDDEAAWSLVEGRYGPLVRAFARRMGVDATIADDARQEVMLAFVQAIRAGRFDRSRGRLRDFLFGIARHCIRGLREREDRRARVTLQPDETGFLERAPDEDHWTAAWNAEWELGVSIQCLREAQERFSAETYLLFQLKALEGLSSAEVAQRTGKTAAAVDMATHHVRTFLRKIRPAIEEAF
jgi:RNA polymerase sigma factor (sigma-70 family)